jgi:hypothetical protein
MGKTFISKNVKKICLLIWTFFTFGYPPSKLMSYLWQEVRDKNCQKKFKWQENYSYFQMEFVCHFKFCHDRKKSIPVQFTVGQFSVFGLNCWWCAVPMIDESVNVWPFSYNSWAHWATFSILFAIESYCS